jgi:hypothetical protein
MQEDWREFLLERVNNLFSNDRGNSMLYGLGHCLAVEKHLREILGGNSEFSGEINAPVLYGAALLHDIGHAKKAKNWALDWFAHIKSGRQLAQDILIECPYFRSQTNLIERILHLIEHHDDTTYSFPISGNNGKPKVTGHKAELNYPELLLLREADSLVHTLDQTVSEAIDEWKLYSLPFNVDNITTIPSWCWNKSIINNIRLLGKRFILDAATKTGKQLSLVVYDRLEKHIKGICLENDIIYETEICHPRDRQTSLERISKRYNKLQIVSFQDLDEVIRRMRGVKLLYENSIHPYEYSKVRLQVVELVKITPMALYIMKGRLEETLEFHDALMAKYAFGLWDLPGLLKFRYNSTSVQKIAPPLIEVYKERGDISNSYIWGLVDGLHRFRVAESLGYNKVWAMIVHDVGYPLVPLPVAWKEIGRSRRS